MKLHAPRKGSLAFSRRKAKNLIPTGKIGERSIWGNKVGITSLEYNGKFTVVTVIELAEMSVIQGTNKQLINTKYCKPFLRVSNYALEPIVGDIKVQSITKGKGFIGVVKMRGIKLGKRKRARANKERHIGCIAPRTGNTTFRSPMGGHKRPQTRTYKTTVIPVEIQAGPWHRYGLIKNSYIVVKGSIPGNIRQVVKIRSCY